ncbi:unnamed protein product [Wuchereria bancrofti]|uniref:Uncharacterized protein n=1 Tax=Wuchereria bancrofti TaxID=6293 RepID=A0A3P7F9L5_WUCBA|nr:unnamed protein product [Wuchereria bancrofti]
MVGGFKVGTFLAYTDIDESLIPNIPDTPVLPAPFFWQRGGNYSLKRRYVPGENQFFPEGGYEIHDGMGGVRNYDLDQVIIHPRFAKHKQAIKLMEEGPERETIVGEVEIVTDEAPKEPGKRGRKPLNDLERQRREQEKIERAQRSGGLRGRPKSNTPKKEPKQPTGGKRGRRPLDPAIKAKREAEKAAKRLITKGLRGRPKSKKPENAE